MGEKINNAEITINMGNLLKEDENLETINVETIPILNIKQYKQMFFYNGKNFSLAPIYIYPKNSYSIIKSPIEIANDRLSALNKKGFSKEFYSELSHITREYIEYSTYIRTLEMTTEEIIGNRDLFHCDDDSFSRWIGLLSKADLVKYAKHSIEPYEMDIDKDKVIDLINNFFPE